MVREAIAAIHRLVAARLEGNLGLLAAIRADRGEHFALRASAAVLGTERCTALRAAARLVLEALLRVELLLADRKDEILTAILAYQCFVLEHLAFPLFGS